MERVVKRVARKDRVDILVVVVDSLKRQIKRPSWLIFNFHSRILDMRTSHELDGWGARGRGVLSSRVYFSCANQVGQGEHRVGFPGALLEEIVRHRSWLVRHSNEILTRVTPPTNHSRASYPPTSRETSFFLLQFAWKIFHFIRTRRYGSFFFGRRVHLL